MLQDFQKEWGPLKTLILLLIIAVSIYLFGIIWAFLGNFSDIIGIVILGWLLGFILEPLVDSLQVVSKLPRGIATLVIYVLVAALFTALIMLFIPVVTAQIQTLTKIIPMYLTTAPKFITRFGDTFTEFLNNSVSFLPSVAQFLFSLVITLVISFYLIVDKDRINEEIYSMLPKKWLEEFKSIQNVIDTTFASFLRVQLIIGVVTGIATWIVLTLTDVPFAAATALLAGLLTAIPLVGPTLGMIPPVFVAFITEPVSALIVLVALFIFQQFTLNILAPKLWGQAFKIHPIIILISFLVGYKIAGNLGALFAIPVLGIGSVILRDISRSILKLRHNHEG